MSFIRHIHNYTEYNEEWNVFSAFNPSKSTHLEPTVQRPGSSRGPPAGAGIRTHNLGLSRVSSPTLYPLGHDCPRRDSTPKNENSVINDSRSCRSKPVNPSFIFRTLIKIFLMKSESSLTLHRQQCNWNVPRPRNVVKHTFWAQRKLK